MGERQLSLPHSVPHAIGMAMRYRRCLSRMPGRSRRAATETYRDGGLCDRMGATMIMELRAVDAIDQPIGN